MRKQVIARAPVRVSFGGGGTDLAAYYLPYVGFVVSAAIDRYCYVVARDSAHGEITINSADYHVRHNTPPGQAVSVEGPLALAKSAVEWFQERKLLPHGVDLFLSSEVQPGTGLGSSSAMTVALLTALARYVNRHLEPHALSEIASYLEIDRLAMPIGKQDQYASAFGGLNAITFTDQGTLVRPLSVPRKFSEELGSHLLLFSTGQSRHSAQILEKQSKDTVTDPNVTASLHLLKQLAHQMEATLERQQLDDFGGLLHQGWRLKKRLSTKISSQNIDEWYSLALESGAVGGKITGAGGGGFLLLYSPIESQSGVRTAMERAGLSELTFGLDFEGAQVVGGIGLEDESFSTASNVVSAHVLSQRRSGRTGQFVPIATKQQEDATHA